MLGPLPHPIHQERLNFSSVVTVQKFALFGHLFNMLIFTLENCSLNIGIFCIFIFTTQSLSYYCTLKYIKTQVFVALLGKILNQYTRVKLILSRFLCIKHVFLEITLFLQRKQKFPFNQGGIFINTPHRNCICMPEREQRKLSYLYIYLYKYIINIYLIYIKIYQYYIHLCLKKYQIFYNLKQY